MIVHPRLCLGLIGLAALAPAPARAKGDIPDTLGVLAPADRPNEIVVATNFGIVVSEDGGATWTWTCDQEISAEAGNYQLGPAPRHRLYAVTGQLLYSDDASCGWQVATSPLATMVGGALFVDPANADRVVATAYVAGTDGGSSILVLESVDGGASFGLLRYTAGVGDFVTAIGGAPGDPMTMYLTLRSGTSGSSTLLRSDDGGASWQSVDITNAVGPGVSYLLAVDHSRPDKVFLRHVGSSTTVGAAPDEALVVAVGGGTTVTTPLVLAGGTMTAFLETADGTLLASGVVNHAPVLFRSLDGGTTFSPVAAPPHIHGLAERGGILYAATSAWDDGFAEATSTDHGTSWQPGLSFDKIRAITACAKARCQTECAYLITSAAVWSDAVCSADAPATGPDAGSGRPDAATPTDAAKPDAAGGTDASDAGPAIARRSGCNCGVSGYGGAPWESAVSLALGLLFSLGSARRRRRG